MRAMSPCSLHLCGLGDLWKQRGPAHTQQEENASLTNWLSSISRQLESSTAAELGVGPDITPAEATRELWGNEAVEEYNPTSCLRACHLFPRHACCHKEDEDERASDKSRPRDWTWHYEVYSRKCFERYAVQARKFEIRLAALQDEISALLRQQID